MANVSAYAQKAMLDWLLGGATPTRPSAWWLGISYGSPTSTSASEVAFARASVTWGAAASPGGSASDAAAIVLASTLWASTVSGWQLWDASAAGNMLWFGLLDNATLPSSKSAFTCAINSARLTAL